jgi:hypothetical protein
MCLQQPIPKNPMTDIIPDELSLSNEFVAWKTRCNEQKAISTGYSPGKKQKNTAKINHIHEVKAPPFKAQLADGDYHC